MRYVIDIDYLARRLSSILRYAREHYRIIDVHANERVTVEDLKESALRIFWNAINREALFPWECWDDDGAIRTWFKGYTLEPIGFGKNNEEICDEPSQELYREVIDVFIIFCLEYFKDCEIRKDKHWEEIRVLEVRSNCLILENMGDWRIRDWERIQREKREARASYY
ncbi:hypothetical protein MOC16_gp322 [Klebsiella phage vB_KpM_FBKp24]|uniref:Uncharacterized protein n=1 Tax=Klebsiella phage vB_KpM_FBKp24 TaxID=2801834 RepID=A0A7U0GBL1_9CAUD|nr:hypothetical protein [Klebsiella pneumoniae]YP_010298728.1 hypothetical protein MOC16_gp322 [Klebsiella phage vB_KpM_FBKp24]QQV92180.1 hypothetical protein vBKpMFBKp24_091 [Klebsiella phage vB_KpM_FBKp24]